MYASYRYILAVATIGTSLGACAGRGAVDGVNDPYESFNRRMFVVEQKLDDYVVEPAAKIYNKLPQQVKLATRNFLNNLSSPVTLVNDLLQTEYQNASATLLRFAINSTIGIGGLFDPAHQMGIERHYEDFGQTLAVYGIPSGPYLYVPGLGPSPPRDLLGRAVDWGFNPITYIADGDSDVAFSFFALDGIDLRADNLSIIDEIERSSVDFYATVRSLYRQNRESEINNGVTDIDELPDIDEFDSLDDY